jgi:hypothetical protein
MTVRSYIHPKGEIFAKSDGLRRSKPKIKQLAPQVDSKNQPIFKRILNVFLSFPLFFLYIYKRHIIYFSRSYLLVNDTIIGTLATI